MPRILYPDSLQQDLKAAFRGLLFRCALSPRRWPLGRVHASGVKE